MSSPYQVTDERTCGARSASDPRADRCAAAAARLPWRVAAVRRRMAAQRLCLSEDLPLTGHRAPPRRARHRGRRGRRRAPTAGRARGPFRRQAAPAVAARVPVLRVMGVRCARRVLSDQDLFSAPYGPLPFAARRGRDSRTGAANYWTGAGARGQAPPDRARCDARRCSTKGLIEIDGAQLVLKFAEPVTRRTRPGRADPCRWQPRPAFVSHPTPHPAGRRTRGRCAPFRPPGNRTGRFATSRAVRARALRAEGSRWLSGVGSASAAARARVSRTLRRRRCVNCFAAWYSTC